jgi:hypothetical protein
MTTWTKSAIVVGIGLVIGAALKTVLPSDRGLTFLYADVFHLVPFNRLAFWLCLGAAVITAALLAAKGRALN